VLLLDDVLSELDEERRERLLDLLERGGQALLTTADPTAIGSHTFARVILSSDVAPAPA
jgi:recombinational DNA repair ATPase RecF